MNYPLSYIEDLTPPTDDLTPNPDFPSAAANLPAPESRQPVAEKWSTDILYDKDTNISEKTKEMMKILASKRYKK